MTSADLTAAKSAAAPTAGEGPAGVIGLLIAGLFALLLLAGCAERAHAAGPPAVVGAVASGFGRLVFTLPENARPEVRLTNGIIVITFRQPVELSVDHLAVAMPGYIAVARRDPDDTAVRIALARKVAINTMTAAEKLFVDLLPEGWVGLPPGLPQEVVDELARRARDAEELVRQRRPAAEEAPRRVATSRVRVATLPTFTRYTFSLPHATSVAVNRDADRLGLIFGSALSFDLLDAKAAIPEIVTGLEAEIGERNTTVRFEFAGKTDVRTFREEGNFIVDVSPVGARSARSPLMPAENGSDDARIAWVPTPTDENAEAKQIAEPDRKVAPTATAPLFATPASSSRGPDQPAIPASAAAKQPPPAVKSAEPPQATPQPNAASDDRAGLPAAGSGDPVIVHAKQQGESLRMVFPFRSATSAAVFRRADTLWLVFDTPVPIDVRRLRQGTDGIVRDATVMRSGQGRAVRLKLDKARLSSMALDATAWIITIGESVLEPTAPLTLSRARSPQRQAVAVISLAGPQQVHRITDPDVGDGLLVVTAHAPARGLLKSQELVEFRALASTHGVAIEPFADDVAVELASDRIVINRPGGLELTPATAVGPDDQAGVAYQRAVFDPQSWDYDRDADFLERRTALMAAVADAPEVKRPAARLDFARFLLARDMAAEAKGVLDAALDGDRGQDGRASALLMRGVANLMLRRESEALKDFSSPIVGDQYAAPVWRGVALSRSGRYAEARDNLNDVEALRPDMPVELQRIIFQEAARCALEVGDLTQAARRLNELTAMGLPAEIRPAALLIAGRLAERLKRPEDALVAYAAAAEASNQPAAAQARLRNAILRLGLKQISREDMVAELEALTVAWRGDETEVEALQLLARFYAEDGRFRDAFRLMRTALLAHPRSQLTYRMQDEASVTFDSVFLGDRGKELSPAEALALFYDFRALTPAGGRGDEMIRRLAERLIAMDLLTQAAELLQHQVDHRLKGAARAQVATRLASVYLMHRKPDRALSALRTTRMNELPVDLRRERLLLEARALSDSSRHDLAIEMIETMRGREVERLRADIHWAARHWRESAEAIERYHGERWREPEPLTPAERKDMLRAAIGYALAADFLGMSRFREKYGTKIAEGPDARMFEIVTAPLDARTDEFAKVAKVASSIDTLEAFLRDLRERYPDPAVSAAAAQGQRS